MRKILSISLLSLILGFTTVYASTEGNDTKPFVGRWYFEEGKQSYSIELDLYNLSKDSRYGTYEDYYYGIGGNTLHIIKIISIQGNNAEVLLEDEGGYDDTKLKASLSYDPISAQISINIPDRGGERIFKQKDKSCYVIIAKGDNVNVRSTPVSGTPLIKGRRGQSFKFLGKEKGWFKVELSPTDKRIGYISPEFASYMKDNKIPNEAFSKSYHYFIKNNGRTGNIKYDIMENLYFEKKGKQIIMTLEAQRTQPDGFPLSSVDLTYAGEIVGNAVIFTRSIGSMFFNDNIDEMDKIDPYILYFDGYNFINDGNVYSPNSN